MISYLSKFLILMSSLAILQLVGCASTPSVENQSLPTQDYTRMTDSQLITYEQQLNDELARSARSTSGDVAVGIGFGSWGNSGGFGVSADKWVGGSEENSKTSELRTRRDAVRAEMRRRGLLQ